VPEGAAACFPFTSREEGNKKTFFSPSGPGPPGDARPPRDGPWPTTLAYVYELFPGTGASVRGQLAGTLVRREQADVAIGRALRGKPDLLLLDEPVDGLAPLAVERIFEALHGAEQGRPDDADGGAERRDGFLCGRFVPLSCRPDPWLSRASPPGLRQDERVKECYLGQA